MAPGLTGTGCLRWATRRGCSGESRALLSACGGTRGPGQEHRWLLSGRAAEPGSRLTAGSRELGQTRWQSRCLVRRMSGLNSMCGKCGVHGKILLLFSIIVQFLDLGEEDLLFFYSFPLSFLFTFTQILPLSAVYSNKTWQH